MGILEGLEKSMGGIETYIEKYPRTKNPWWLSVAQENQKNGTADPIGLIDASQEKAVKDARLIDVYGWAITEVSESGDLLIYHRFRVEYMVVLKVGRTCHLVPVCLPKTVDEINHPPHYTHAGQGMETIDVIEKWGLGFAFCAGNAIKYLSRAEHKGSEIQDLKKALWYIRRTQGTYDEPKPGTAAWVEEFPESGEVSKAWNLGRELSAVLRCIQMMDFVSAELLLENYIEKKEKGL